MSNNQFNARTPLNQEPQRGPNFCPYCDYWHPVASMVPDHVHREHADRVPRLPKETPTPEQAEANKAARAEKIAEIRARKAERDRKKAS